MANHWGGAEATREPDASEKYHPLVSQDSGVTGKATAPFDGQTRGEGYAERMTRVTSALTVTRHAALPDSYAVAWDECEADRLDEVWDTTA